MTRNYASLMYSLFGVIRLLLMCIAFMYDTNAIDFEEACHTKRHTSCELRQNFLQCNSVQPTNAWNITLRSVVPNIAGGDAALHSNAVLAYRNATSNKNVFENGVCRLRINSRSSSRKKLHCRFLTSADTKLVYKVHNKRPRHKPCQCVCAFNVSEYEDTAVQPNSKHVTARSAEAHSSKLTENLDPTVISYWETSTSIGYAKIIVQIRTQHKLYLRLLKGDKGDCCKNDRAELLRRLPITESKKEVFDDLPIANYCIRFTTVDPESSRPTRTLCSYVNIPHASNITSETPTVITKFTKSDPEKILYVVIGVATVVVVPCLLCLIMYINRRLRNETHHPAANTKGKETELCEPFVNQDKRKKIFVLYSHDCDAFVDVIKAFSSFLEVNFDCDVAYAERDTDSLVTCQQAWLEDKLNSDVIIVVNSEGACLRQEAWLEQRSLVPRGDFADCETCVFDQALEMLTRNVEAAYDYEKVFVVSFTFTVASKKLRLKNVVPNRLHEIPQNLEKLCSAAKLGKLKISENIFLTENDAAYQNLLFSIITCENWLKKNPRAVSECFVPLDSRPIHTPNTLPFSPNHSEEDTDVTFSSPQSSCTNLSETYPLTALDV